MDLSNVFQLISLAIIVLWTVRLARAKGLNPLLWGVGSALLMAVGWFVLPEEWRRYMVFIGMAPLVFLLLFRSPLFRRRSDNAPAAPVAATHSAPACPRCAVPDAGGQNYCVHCGWDLSQTYTPAAEIDEITAAPPVTTPSPEQAAAAVLETTLEDVKAAPAAEPVPESLEITQPEPAIPAVTPEPAPVLAQDTEPPAPTETTPAAPASTPRRIPTAANLTERGIALFRQGRFQEAVDQFTKAIALDPKYKQAWEQRAEAYGRLGRAERQAADRRQLETI